MDADERSGGPFGTARSPLDEPLLGNVENEVDDQHKDCWDQNAREDTHCIEVAFGLRD